MADLLLSQAFSAGKKVLHMVETAKDCIDEGKELAGRVHSTLELMREAVPTFENNAFLRKSLLEVKTLFERIDDLLQLCLPQEQQHDETSSTLRNAAHTAKRVYFSEQNLKTLKEYSDKLDSIALDFSGPMQVVAKQQANRMEEALLAIQITLDKGTDPSLKLMKRLVKGNVVDEELEELDETLGSGSFGLVMAGRYYGKPVAIKRALSSVFSAEDRETFRREAGTHFALRHDRIVQVIAFRTGGGSRPPCLVMERMERTLFHFLGINPAPLDLSGSLPFIIDICEGLKYLHQGGVLHRDIKSHNILLRNGGAKVSDFGLAHVCSTIGRKTGNDQFLDEKAGTKFWMAPEVLSWGESSFDSDVFSLHVVLWEIIENRQGGTGDAIGDVLRKNPLEKLPIEGEGDGSDPAKMRLHKLIRTCGLLNRKDRPKIGEVLAEAKSIYDSLPRSGDVEEPSPATAHPLQGRDEEEGHLRPSESRRRAQEAENSNSSRGPWESWKDFDPCGVGAETKREQPNSQGEEALREQIDRIVATMDGMKEGIQERLMSLERFQAPNYPYPHLVMVQEIKTQGKRSPLSKLRGLKLTLHFLCPVDMGKVPCGMNGEGYRFSARRSSVMKLAPALQVVMANAKVALRAALGLDVDISDFLKDFKDGLVEEIVDRALDEDVLLSVVNGDQGASTDMKRAIRASYEAMKNLMEEKLDRGMNTKGRDGYIDFREKMQPVGDGRGGMVWVRTENVRKWRDSLSLAAPSK